MKKICPECEHINPYENSKCEKCGAELDVSVKYKICPNCGKRFDNLQKTECDECRERLIVRGRPAAKIYDEKQKDEIPLWFRFLCIFLPVIGIVMAIVYVIIKDNGKSLKSETLKNFLVTVILVQLVLIGIGIFIFMFINGSAFDLMKNISQR